MDFFDCRLLRALHEHKNITRASHILFTSQPALTKRLQGLEQEFGVKLFIRHSKGISFTPAGEYLVSAAERMVSDYDLVSSEVKTIGGNRVSGLLKVGAIYLLNERIIPDILAEFARAYPEVTYDVLSQPNITIYNKLTNKELHIAFLREQFNWADQKLLVDREELLIVSSDPISMEDLPDLPRIDPARNSKFNAALEQWWVSRYKAPPRVIAHVSNSNTGLELVARGMGYSIVAGTALRGREDQFFKMPVCNTDGSPMTRDTWLYYREEGLRHPPVKAFIQFVKQYYTLST